MLSTGCSSTALSCAQALQPAPIGVTWIGYPNTTVRNRAFLFLADPLIVRCDQGLPTIQYRITDAIVDPIDTKQKALTCFPDRRVAVADWSTLQLQFSEELLRLPGPFLCYTPPSDAPAVGQTPALASGFITFGSFNNLAKAIRFCTSSVPSDSCCFCR